jgi:hypothetical protein
MRMQYRYDDFGFTTPRELWAKVARDGGYVPWARKAILRVLDQLFSENGRYQLGGVTALQTWHTSNPFAGDCYHWHGQLWYVAYDRVEQRMVRLTRKHLLGKYFVNGERMDALQRRLWREELESRYGKLKSADVYVWLRFKEGRGHMRHDISYGFRSFVQDAYRYIESSKVPEDADLEFVQRAMHPARYSKRVSRFGWFGGSVMYKRISNLKVELPKKPERLRTRRKMFCPHGFVMESLRLPPMSYDEVVASGGLFAGYAFTGGGHVD